MTDPYMRERLERYLREYPECARDGCIKSSAGIRIVEIPAKSGNPDDNLISLQALCELHLEIEDALGEEAEGR